jgi:formylmethanofuran dehydrogenase subunit E
MTCCKFKLVRTEREQNFLMQAFGFVRLVEWWQCKKCGEYQVESRMVSINAREK